MNCIADVHYDVVRQAPRHGGEIKGLQCKFCTFYVSKFRTPMPRGTSSGLGRYNRMRAKMVRHLHQFHREELEPTPSSVPDVSVPNAASALTWEDHVYPSEARERGWDDSRKGPRHGCGPNPFMRPALRQAYDEGFADYRRDDPKPWEVLRPIIDPDDPEVIIGHGPDPDWL